MIHEVEERLPLQSQGSKALNVGRPDSLLLEFDDDPDGLNRLDLLNDLIIKSEPTKDYLRVHCKVTFKLYLSLLQFARLKNIAYLSSASMIRLKSLTV